MMTSDFAALWQHYKENDPHGRVRAEVDRTFWAEHAIGYDQSQPACPTLLTALSAYIQPTDTLLDVGAGTGRFTLPLAQQAQHVTALDHAPAMLELLRQKQRAQGITNLSVVQSTWEAAEVVPHDVVLVAWSLYRQVDILTALQKLIRTTRRTLLIVESDDDSPQYPHQPLIDELWGKRDSASRDLSKYLIFAGVLWQLGVRAEMRVIHEQGTRLTASPDELARELAPSYASPTELGHFATQLRPHLEPQADGRWLYRYTYPIELIVWERFG